MITDRTSPPWGSTMRGLRVLGRVAGLLTFLLGPWLLLRVPSVQAAAFGGVDSLRAMGAAGLLVYGGFYVVCAALAAPLSLLAGLAGFIFGPLWGLAVAPLAAVLGTSLGFAMARRFAGGWITTRFGGSARFAQVQAVMRDRGFRVALLLRLSPLVPQNVLTFALAGMAITVADFARATFFGLLPATIVQVVVGSLGRSAAAVLRGDVGADGTRVWLGALALVCSVAMLAVASVVARRSLARIVAVGLTEAPLALPTVDTPTARPLGDQEGATPV